MADKNIRIRIGASLDADLAATVFAPLVTAARRAATQIKAELEKGRPDFGDASGSGGVSRAAARRRGGGTDPEVAQEKSKAAEIRRIQKERNKDHAQFLKGVETTGKAHVREVKTQARELAGEQRKQQVAAVAHARYLDSIGREQAR
jgi:hypothetical protein